jgi:hypothetical protein
MLSLSGMCFQIWRAPAKPRSVLDSAAAWRMLALRFDSDSGSAPRSISVFILSTRPEDAGQWRGVQWYFLYFRSIRSCKILRFGCSKADARKYSTIAWKRGDLPLNLDFHCAQLVETGALLASSISSMSLFSGQMFRSAKLGKGFGASHSVPLVEREVYPPPSNFGSILLGPRSRIQSLRSELNDPLDP